MTRLVEVVKGRAPNTAGCPRQVLSGRQSRETHRSTRSELCGVDFIVGT